VLFADQVAERYTPPRAICWEGEPATHVFHLLEGCLRVCRTMEDGRRAILCFGYAGDLLCLSAIDTYPFTAEAVTPVRFKRLTRRRFADLVETDADLRAQLLAEVCGEMRVAQDQIIASAVRPPTNASPRSFSKWRSAPGSPWSAR
jgi:CRP/FNR family transcriptional regulator, anaerobic regulatory protein